MTTKLEIRMLENELNTQGSRMTKNGNNNHINVIDYGKYYNICKDGVVIGVSVNAKECVAVLYALCSIL